MRLISFRTSLRRSFSIFISDLMSRFNIHPTCRVGELANKQVLDLTAVLSEMKIEAEISQRGKGKPTCVRVRCPLTGKPNAWRRPR
jgi:hypothetical protein